MLPLPPLYSANENKCLILLTSYTAMTSSPTVQMIPISNQSSLSLTVAPRTLDCIASFCPKSAIYITYRSEEISFPSRSLTTNPTSSKLRLFPLRRGYAYSTAISVQSAPYTPLHPRTRSPLSLVILVYSFSKMLNILGPQKRRSSGKDSI